MHAVGARLVGRGGDDLAGPAGITVAADDHRPPGQLGPAEDLDGGEELVEVDVEDPVLRGHAATLGPCRRTGPARMHAWHGA